MRKVRNSHDVNSNRRHIDTQIHLGWNNPLFLNHSFKSCQTQIHLGQNDPLFLNHSFKSYQTQILLGRNDPLFLNHLLGHYQMLHFSLDSRYDDVSRFAYARNFFWLTWLTDFLMSHGKLLAIPRQWVMKKIKRQRSWMKII